MSVIEIPPTEIELADALLWMRAIPIKQANVIRRLAFERGMLRAELAAMRQERDRIAKDHGKQMRAAQAAAHVIIETCVVPGVDSPCRCDECRYVARALDDIGYLEDVADADRWWIQPKEGKSDG